MVSYMGNATNLNRLLALLLLISLSAAAQESVFRDGFENLPPAECRNRAVTFRVASTVGTAGAPAEWPGGTDIRSFEPRCSVTVARPSGPVDAGGDAFEVVRFTGYSHCFGVGGQDNDGCSVRTCPAAEFGECTESRPQCPAAAVRRRSACDAAPPTGRPRATRRISSLKR